MLHNSALVDAAVVMVLVNDPTLAGLMPDGVYFNVAPLNAARFVSLERVGHTDTYGFNFEAWELFRYQIKAVALNSNGSDVDAAADRIHTLLQDNFALAIDTYAVMRFDRMTAIRYLDPDPLNASIRWQHRGGIYELQVTGLDDTVSARGALAGTR